MHKAKKVTINGEWVCGAQWGSSEKSLGIGDLRFNYAVDLKTSISKMDGFITLRSKGDVLTKKSLIFKIHSNISINGDQIKSEPFYVEVENFDDGNSVKASEKFLEGSRVDMLKPENYSFHQENNEQLTFLTEKTVYYCARP